MTQKSIEKFDNRSSDFFVENNHARMSGRRVAKECHVHHRTVQKWVGDLTDRELAKTIVAKGFDGGDLKEFVTRIAMSQKVPREVREHNVRLLSDMAAVGFQVAIDKMAGIEQKPAVPQTYKEALLALVAEIEAKEQLEAERQLLEKENHQLSEAVDELFDYSSIIRVAKFNECSEKAFSWRKLKAASQLMELEIKRVPCPRFEYKNLYSHDVWRFVYPAYRLPETTTLVIRND